MNIELFVLADYAADQGGKLTIVGIFDTIAGSKMPIVHPHVSVAVKMRFQSIEAGSKRARVTLSDPDGKQILPSIDLPLEVQMGPNQHTCTKQIVANIGGLKIDAPGDYSFDLAIDGRHEGSIPLFVRQIHMKPKGEPGAAPNA